MPPDVLRKEAMHHAARYCSELSWPILDALAAASEIRGEHLRALDSACINAIQQASTPFVLAALFGDLVCALNGTDALLWVTGMLIAKCPGREPEPEPG